jgi:hypothetical protein
MMMASMIELHFIVHDTRAYIRQNSSTASVLAKFKSSTSLHLETTLKHIKARVFCRPLHSSAYQHRAAQASLTSAEWLRDTQRRYLQSPRVSEQAMTSSGSACLAG